MIPSSLRHRRFFLFWLGITISWAGVQMLTWTIPWHIRTITAEPDPFALGVIGLIRVLPTILLSLFAGIAADRFSRKGVIFVSQMVMALAGVGLWWFTSTEAVTLWLIYLMVGVQAIAFTFNLPARQAIVPNLVPAKDLPNALSMQIISFQIGGLIGPWLSGYLLDVWGQASTYTMSAVLTSFMLIMLFFIGPVHQEKMGASARGVDWPAIKEGVVFTFGHPLILSSMLLDFLATFFVRADQLISIIAVDVLGVGARGYGWLSSAQALGATAAGLILSQRRGIKGQGVKLLAAVGMIGVGAVIFGTANSFPVAMVGLMIMGASDAVSSVIRNTIRQLNTPDKLRGRMVSVNQIFFMGGPQLGELKSGILGQFIGVPLAIATGGVACLLSVGWVARRWPQLRVYDREMETME